MIHTVDLLPPGFGPRANPLLFGVSEGLLRLFPLPAVDLPAAVEKEASFDARPEAAPAPTPPAVQDGPRRA